MVFRNPTIERNFIQSELIKLSINFIIIVIFQTLSWADIHCYYILDMLSQHFGINMADYPELKKVYDGVVAEPNIKKWLEERPKTDH